MSQKLCLNEDIRNTISKTCFHGGLVLDEMNIQNDLQVSSRGSEWRLTGLTDLGEAGNAMAAIQKNPPKTRYPNVCNFSSMVLQALNCPFHNFLLLRPMHMNCIPALRKPFPYFPSTQANACDLYIKIQIALSIFLYYYGQCMWIIHKGIFFYSSIWRNGWGMWHHMLVQCTCGEVPELGHQPNKSPIAQ